MILKTIYHFTQLQRNVWRSPKELETVQNHKLRALIEHAYANVPYYRRLFDECGVHPLEIQEARDLTRIPATTKMQLQELPLEDITAPGLDRAKAVDLQRTSGSTGQPFDIYNYAPDRDYLTLVWARAFLANGVRLGDNRAFVEDPPSFAEAPRWFQKLGIWSKVGISCYNDPDECLRILQTLRADVLCGFPSSLAKMASSLADRNWDGIRPRLVFTRGELLDDVNRRTIEKGFHAPVRDLYGTTEHGLIAWECPVQAGYHINMDSVIVEFLVNGHPVQPGERAELVCTALQSYAMPLIRYRTGDVGVQNDTPCPCGRILPLMQVVMGRLVDHIHLPDGRTLSPYLFTNAVEKVPGITRFQIVQQTPEHIDVYVIAGPNWMPQNGAELQARCQNVIPNSMTVQVHQVHALSSETSGKFSVVKSNIRPKIE